MKVSHLHSSCQRLTAHVDSGSDANHDPAFNTLLLRLHVETARRRAGALALRPQNLDPAQCLIFLREKGETVRWQLTRAVPGHRVA